MLINYMTLSLGVELIANGNEPLMSSQYFFRTYNSILCWVVMRISRYGRAQALKIQYPVFVQNVVFGWIFHVNISFFFLLI